MPTLSETHREAINSLLSAISVEVCPIADVKKQLTRVAIASDYVLNQLTRFPSLFIDLIESGDLNREYSEDAYQKRINTAAEGIDDYDELALLLRQIRHREIVRIIWRDVLLMASLDEVMRDMSALADACINMGIQKLQSWLEKDYGVPCDANNNRQAFQVVAMGKLGGRELNLSSDVDLIFCYPGTGFTQGASKSISNQLFFIKLGQRLVKLLNTVTVEGFVFRVDMRLRPHGESGPLVMSHEALKSYFDTSARQWERYAYIKARVIGGDEANNEALLRLFQRFIYQDSTDTEIMTTLKGIKEKISRKVAQDAMQKNIKLGAGGIREVEFIAQAFQLIYGGKDDPLKTRHLLVTLKHLKEHLYLSPEVADRLAECYRFFRILENRLQALEDKQTHTLPSDQHVQHRLTETMDFDSWADLEKSLQHKQQFVSEKFSKLVNLSIQEISIHKDKSIKDIAFKRQAELVKMIDDWQQHLIEENLAVHEFAAWDNFREKLIQALQNRPDPQAVLQRILSLLTFLLKEKDIAPLFASVEAVNRLVKISASSIWLAEALGRYPCDVVELLTSDSIDPPEDLKTMQLLLQKNLLAIEGPKTEADLFDVLRDFKREHVVRTALADVLGQLSVMRVSDLLTDIAITIIRQVLIFAWRELVEAYGKPKKVSGDVCDLDFVVVAYGKLGGIELGYNSDLDLVFLHDADDNALTTGENAITGAQFYVRLGKRIIDILSTQTTIGPLYKIDTQLKPMGKAGSLVSSFTTFANYQREDAWTWEHQALVRARVIAGDDRLKTQFVELRREILSRPRDIKQLKKDIVDMRDKMREEKKSEEGVFNLKRDVGGITDIEFIAQFVVLAWSQYQAFLLMFPDNIRIFETCESGGLLSRKTVDTLCDAYREFRKARHHLALHHKRGIVSSTKFRQLRHKVEAIWGLLLLD